MPIRSVVACLSFLILHGITVASSAGVDWSKVDFQSLEALCEGRGVELGDQDIEVAVRRSFQFLFENKTNHQRFLSRPSPETIAGAMIDVLETQQELSDLLESAWGDAGEPIQMNRQLELIKDVRRLSRRLGASFRRYFVDLSSGSHTMAVPSSRNPRLFKAYLHEAQRTNRILNARLERYFFSASGAIEVADLKAISIGSLTDALAKLSDLSLRRLRESAQ